MSAQDPSEGQDPKTEPESETDSRTHTQMAAAAASGRTAVYDALWPFVARVAALGDVFRSTEGRTAVLVIVAYLTGTVGLGLSLFGDPADPTAKYGSAGIALMGVTFACLFLLSMSVLNATGERPYQSGRRGRSRGGPAGRSYDDDDR